MSLRPMYQDPRSQCAYLELDLGKRWHILDSSSGSEDPRKSKSVGQGGLVFPRHLLLERVQIPKAEVS